MGNDSKCPKMVGDCRICASADGIERLLTIGDGAEHRWPVCDGCVDALRDLPWVDVQSTGEGVRLAVAPGGLARALEAVTGD